MNLPEISGELGPAKLNFLFLDCTFNFMDPNQVKKFAQAASGTLTQNGMVLATIRARKRDMLLGFRNNIPSKVLHGMRIYYYNENHLSRLTTPNLKLNLVAEFKTGRLESNTLLILSRLDSPFSTHQGYPYYFERE